MTVAIGQKIRAAREARGWSQDQLADRVGATQSTIDRIESGLTHRSRYMHRIVSELGLSDAASEYIEYNLLPNGKNKIQKIVISLNLSSWENLEKFQNNCDFSSKEDAAKKLVEQGLLRYDNYRSIVDRFYINLKNDKPFRSTVKDVLGDHPLVNSLSYDDKWAKIVLTNNFKIDIENTGMATIWDSSGKLFVHDVGEEPVWADPQNVDQSSKKDKKQA